jgi:hypothetical protein
VHLLTVVGMTTPVADDYVPAAQQATSHVLPQQLWPAATHEEACKPGVQAVYFLQNKLHTHVD